MVRTGASHFEDILVGVVPPCRPSSAQNRGNHGGIAPTRSVKSLKLGCSRTDFSPYYEPFVMREVLPRFGVGRICFNELNGEGGIRTPDRSPYA